MHITILLTLSIPSGEAELPIFIRWDAHLHAEPPGSDLNVIYVLYIIESPSKQLWSFSLLCFLHLLQLSINGWYINCNCTLSVCLCIGSKANVQNNPADGWYRSGLRIYRKKPDYNWMHLWWFQRSLAILMMAYVMQLRLLQCLSMNRTNYKTF